MLFIFCFFRGGGGRTDGGFGLGHPDDTLWDRFIQHCQRRIQADQEVCARCPLQLGSAHSRIRVLGTLLTDCRVRGLAPRAPLLGLFEVLCALLPCPDVTRAHDCAMVSASQGTLDPRPALTFPLPAYCVRLCHPVRHRQYTRAVRQHRDARTHLEYLTGRHEEVCPVGNGLYRARREITTACNDATRDKTAEGTCLHVCANGDSEDKSIGVWILFKSSRREPCLSPLPVPCISSAHPSWGARTIALYA